MGNTAPCFYVRGLRQADHAVFCVADGQKTYYDPQFRQRLPYSSGQQVKRSLLDSACEYLSEPRAPITFNYKINKGGKVENKEPWSPCDPRCADQLLGGWMRARSDTHTIKRRAPLSISAMRPLHPLLATSYSENLTFDRSEHPEQHPVRVVNAEDQEMSAQQIEEFLSGQNRTLPRRHWIPDQRRAAGLFVYDAAVDRGRLFKVSLNRHDPELDEAMIEALRKDGWKESADGLSLICPPDRRERLIDALAHALIHWRVTSNQSRTFSLQPTLALAISGSAGRIADTIRAELNEESESPSATPCVEVSNNGTAVYVAPACRAFIAGLATTADALEEAEKDLARRLRDYDYDA